MNKRAAIGVSFDDLFDELIVNISILVGHDVPETSHVDQFLFQFSGYVAGFAEQGETLGTVFGPSEFFPADGVIGHVQRLFTGSLEIQDDDVLLVVIVLKQQIRRFFPSASGALYATLNALLFGYQQFVHGASTLPLLIISLRIPDRSRFSF